MSTIGKKRVEASTRMREGRGFTLAETLIVVAILAVLMAVAFVGVIQWRKTLKQLEYDATAKELFVAAQNHLALAESQGLLEETVKEGGVTKPAFARGTQVEGTDEYYFVFGTGTDDPSKKDSLFYLMLPFGSIDETVRAGGSYIIHYQPDAAVVLDVFYTGDTNKGKLSSDDYAELMNIRDDKSARLSYGANKIIVGYYGGGNRGQAPIKLQPPTVQVENGDVLKVVVTYPEKNFDRLSETATNLTLIIEEVPLGESDPTMGEAQRSIDLKAITNKTLVDGSYVYEDDALVLDDVTKPSGSISKSGNWTGTFTPGRNLKMYVEAQSNGSGGSTAIAIARSAEVETNSLFAKTAAVAEDPSTHDASLSIEITSFRHLANLSEAVSGFTGAGYLDVKAAQTTDLSWGSFKKNVSLAHFNNEAHASETSIYFGEDSHSATGTWQPVALSSDYQLTYDGIKPSDGTEAPTAHRIIGVDVAAEGQAGIFGEFSGDASALKNLVIVNANIVATGTRADAGALLGKLSGKATISNVLVRSSLRRVDASRGVTSTDVAGGLVGTVDSGTVTKSAAAVYVKATGGIAGGLAGIATGSTISESYASGHVTNAGKYDKEAVDVDAKSGSSIGVAAGGLVGSASTTAISSCYSTCSAGNAAKVGGLVGGARAGSISNCYATGLVTNPTATDANGSEVFTGSVGSFVGERESGASATSLTGDYFYQVVNGTEVVPIGNEDGDDSPVKPFDSMSHGADGSWIADSALNEYFTTSASAVPYNQELAVRYSGKYAFKTIATEAEVASSQDFTDHLTRHYGDWPSYEVMVINQQ